MTIGGVALAHRLYQFAFANSGWRHARVVLGGESFQALPSGMQEALWMAGGVLPAKLDRFDLIILDDLSYARRDQAETSVLFELIAERYERKSIAITANAPFSDGGRGGPPRASPHDPGDERGQLPPPRCVAGSPATQRNDNYSMILLDRTAQDN